MAKFGNPNKVVTEPDRGQPDVMRLVDPRAEGRQPKDFQALCVCGEPPQRVACKILDMSNSGAKLAFASTALIPAVFKVYIAELNVVLDCRVASRTEIEMGVEHVTSWVS